jgi:hypothetical protein
MSLSFNEVKRLENSSNHLKKKDEVLAVFPLTTSFYPGVVVKNPKANDEKVSVRFDDDEDESGKVLFRLVEERLVLLKRDMDNYNDDDNEDEVEG